jgi:mersacidin/lichenicidin family type 2 lantibiotic
MSKKEKTVRAWKDQKFRASLTPEEKADIPEHPAGEEATEDDLEKTSGGQGAALFPITSGGHVCTLTTECGCPWGN